MTKKTLWEGANKHVVEKLQKDIPAQGPVTDKNRPKLEAHRKMQNAYYDHYNNGSINNRGPELRAAAKTVGEKAPKQTELKTRHHKINTVEKTSSGEEYKGVRYIKDPVHEKFTVQPAREKLEHIARKVTAEAAKEHRRVYGSGHDMKTHGEGKPHGHKE